MGARRSIRNGTSTAVTAVIRAQRWLDSGVLIHLDGCDEAMRFARSWQSRHPYDRVTIFNQDMEPITSLDAADTLTAGAG